MAVREEADKVFDLVPDPRVLQMLGEITLAQWRCLSELIDNSVDGFLSAARSGNGVTSPEVRISVPKSASSDGMIRVRDNGPGMDVGTLERAVRAGWTSNNPMDNLGLFGMGFNISTARLATTTQVWTTRAGDPEWSGLEIDFNQLRKQGHYKTPRISRPKEDSSIQGTEIVLRNLKSEHLEYFSKSANRTNIKKQLSKVYSSMLRDNGDPISFSLHFDGHKLQPHRHCVWDSDRSVHVANVGDVPAVIEIEVKLAARHFCSFCMAWKQDAEPCAACPSPAAIELRERKLRGWIGLQRYRDGRDYGVDFIRNGRKIELQNKDLFIWQDEDGEEVEYPIDDQRNLGRFVGEIHIDHGRVSYSKDRFERLDPAWDEMVHLVRGEGPLRPNIAAQRGFGDNNSPLAQLFKAFRRTSPSSSSSGWARILCVKDNERAKEMARKFHDGEPEYQNDAKWWELVEEQDNEALRGPSGGDEAPLLPEGLGDDVDEGEGSGEGGNEGLADGDQQEPISVERHHIASLSREYRHKSSNQLFTIEAWEAAPNDPLLRGERPWALELADTANRIHRFVVDPSHPLFRSMTLTPLDALLAELAHTTFDYWRTVSGHDYTFAGILTEFREAYASSSSLDPMNIAAEAARLLQDVAKGLVSNSDNDARSELYDELPQTMKSEVLKALAANGVTKVAEVQASGNFLELAPGLVLRFVVENNLHLMMDGRFWDRPYEALDYGDSELNERVRLEAKGRLMNLLDDVVWAAELSKGSESHSRAELARARMSIELLQPTTDVE